MILPQFNSLAKMLNGIVAKASISNPLKSSTKSSSKIFIV